MPPQLLDEVETLLLTGAEAQVRVADLVDVSGEALGAPFAPPSVPTLTSVAPLGEKHELVVVPGEGPGEASVELRDGVDTEGDKSLEIKREDLAGSSGEGRSVRSVGSEPRVQARSRRASRLSQVSRPAERGEGAAQGERGPRPPGPQPAPASRLRLASAFGRPAPDAGDAAQGALEDAIRAMLGSPHGMAPGEGEHSDAGSTAPRAAGRCRDPSEEGARLEQAILAALDSPHGMAPGEGEYSDYGSLVSARKSLASRVRTALQSVGGAGELSRWESSGALDRAIDGVLVSPHGMAPGEGEYSTPASTCGGVGRPSAAGNVSRRASLGAASRPPTGAPAAAPGTVSFGSKPWTPALEGGGSLGSARASLSGRRGSGDLDVPALPDARGSVAGGRASLPNAPPSHERMRQARKERIDLLVRRQWYKRLLTWTSVSLIALFAAVARVLLRRPAPPPELLPGDRPAVETPASLALAASKRRLDLLSNRRKRLQELRLALRDYEDGCAAAVWVPGYRWRERKKLTDQMLTLGTELMGMLAPRGVDWEAGGEGRETEWEEIRHSATSQSALRAAVLVAEAIDAEQRVKDGHDAVFARERRPVLEEEQKKLEVQRAAVETACEAQASALEELRFSGWRRDGKRVPGAERERLREDIRAKMAVIRDLDAREDRIARDLNKLGLSDTAHTLAARDRHQQLRALMLGLWSSSMWAMWARPLVAEKWMAVDKSLMTRMKESRQAKKERQKAAQLAKQGGFKDEYSKIHTNEDTRATFMSAIRGVLAIG